MQNDIFFYHKGEQCSVQRNNFNFCSKFKYVIVEIFFFFFYPVWWSKRKSRLMVDTRRAPATASINSAHAHLGDKLSELYHILWRNVDSVRTTVPREGKRSFESTRRYRSSSTRQSGPRQFHRKVSKQWFSNHHSFILPFLFKRRLEMSFFLSFFYFSTSKLFHHHRIANTCAN